MQVTEVVADGLKREFKVTVPAEELDKRLVDRLNAMKSEVRLKGFRPGKVPVSHLKKMFGQQTMAEIVQGILSEVARDTLADRGEKAAMQPEFKLPEGDGGADGVLRGETDLVYTMAFDVLPSFELTDFKQLKVERLKADVPPERLEARLNELADSTRSYATKSEPAADGDQITIAYVGRIGGETFDGGSNDNATITIGAGRMVPGFESSLIGLSTGDKTSFTITFPDDYPNDKIAGEDATFDVEVKAVAAPEDMEIDDDFAERLGMEDLAALKEALEQQIRIDYDQASRQKVKRALLDELERTHDFDLPERLVEQEFEAIWRQVTDELQNSQKTFEDEDTTEEEARAEYTSIAERRVRLGLVMSEIGERAEIQVTEEEVQRALSAQMRQFPGQEQALIEYYRKNPDAVAALRAPIFEEKVVDYLLELVQVSERSVSVEELMRDDDEAAPAESED